MKLRFSIQYSTKWGENVWVVVKAHVSTGVMKTYRLCLLTDDGEHWTAELAVMESRHSVFTFFEYEYQIRGGDDVVLRREWHVVPRIIPCDNSHDFVMNDEWKDIPLMAHLYTKACMCTSGRKNMADATIKALRQPLYRKTLFFRITAPQIDNRQAVAVCGSHPSLGGWSTSRYLKMSYNGHSVWTLTMNVDALYPEIEYKYVVVDDENHEFVEWEGGENRKVDISKMRDGEVVVLDNGTLRVAEKTWKAAGVAVPVFSLRSEHSYGVGDFGDLARFADWMALAGMKILQILPVNDTTMQHNWQDSYPYNIISVFALHPQYLDLEQVGELKDKALMTSFSRRRAELNSLDYTDYEAVERVKDEYMRIKYEEVKDKLDKDDNFRTFIADNKTWLLPYTAFCLLREANRTARFADWGENAVYDYRKAEELCNCEDARYIFFIQYHLHTQLKRAAEHAAEKGIAIMGDMPIGVSRDSAEAWANPAIFNLDSQAGTIPDNLNPRGQNWGFPTYNWKNIEADGFKWWHKRIKHMEQYFGAIRIDHVLGFFRMWEIPNENIDGLLGHFAPSMPLNEAEMGYYGLSFHKDNYTKPIIDDALVDRVFGIHAKYVRENYLTPRGYNLYDLRDECSTQKKIMALFGGRHDESSIWIRDGLCRIATNVLFVADEGSDMYHPRVNAFSTPAYNMLGPADRDAFMRLYNNYYYERHNALWAYTGSRRLSMVFGGTKMLTCAEDLGHKPGCVAGVLDHLRIPSLEIQFMPKHDEVDFAHLEANPYLSMATITTHDMAPLRLWWQENPQKAQHYYVEMMQKEGRAPEQLTTVLAEEIIARHLYSPSMLCVLSIQDWLSMDAGLRSAKPRLERINTPGDSYNRWQYRMNVTIERLMADSRYISKVNTMIKRSKR